MAFHRHTRDTNARRTTRTKALLSAAAAAVATTAAVAVGVASSSPAGSAQSGGTTDGAAGSAAVADVAGVAAPGSLPSRATEVSRDRVRASLTAEKSEPGDYLDHRLGLEELRAEFQRKQAAAERRATREAVRGADTRRWATEDLDVWSDSGSGADELGLVETGDEVLLTGREADGRTEVVLDGESRWVTSGYFSAEEPSPLDAACTNGSSVPSSISPNVIAVHQAVCANFPEITVYGTLRSDGDHSKGIAIDIMVSGDRGWEVAEFLQENYVALGIDYVIYSQQIWQPGSSYSGWQGMEDRGSITANHYDHVHVTTYY